jgi:hypothetical protein
MRFPPRNDTTTTSGYVVRSVRPSIAYIPSWSISDQSACEWLHRDQRTRCNHTACSTLLLFYHLALMDWNVSAHGLERLRRGTYAGHRYTSSRCVASIRRGKRVRWCAAAAVQHNARTRSGPPSTRATVFETTEGDRHTDGFESVVTVR